MMYYMGWISVVWTEETKICVAKTEVRKETPFSEAEWRALSFEELAATALVSHSTFVWKYFSMQLILLTAFFYCCEFYCLESSRLFLIVFKLTRLFIVLSLLAAFGQDLGEAG